MCSQTLGITVLILKTSLDAYYPSFLQIFLFYSSSTGLKRLSWRPPRTSTLTWRAPTPSLRLAPKILKTSWPNRLWPTTTGSKSTLRTKMWVFLIKRTKNPHCHNLNFPSKENFPKIMQIKYDHMQLRLSNHTKDCKSLELNHLCSPHWLFVSGILSSEIKASGQYLTKDCSNFKIEQN